MPVEGTRTVTVHVAFTPLVAVAVMVAVPLPLAVTVPSAATAATLLLDEVNCTESVVSEGVMVAIKDAVSLTFSVRLVSFNWIPVAGTSTVITHSALIPKVVSAVITAVPFAFAVTRPEEATCAIVGSELLQVTVSSQSEGRTVAVSKKDSETFSVLEVAFSVMPVGFVFTVTAHVALTPLLAVAVIVAEPFLTAVNVPSVDTLTADVLLEDHVTLSVLPSGDNVAFSFSVSPA